ncbi:two-component system response regulator CreB [Chiayiivirga flava]|uniref:Two-component system catabolic regulation response regulator CreB n=1 Tax=Chiayiivirga flava TaxID=659595 RepID=A0A7W8D565_9GAMM|nr:two-component system response regulator CreB [Chiayiivirga flava]MBB5208121.1 two-component system catabolic regulation response regulator CreB [Chiayiivirga flava]
MPRLLLVEDELAIADTVLYAMAADGIAADHVTLGATALAKLRADAFDVAVFDVGLPDMTGFELCREVRRFASLPILFLTARGGEIDRVVGLEIGADDYVVKPFSPRELVARVRAILRRVAPEPASQSAHIGPFQHDRAGLAVRYAGTPLALTRYEYLLLAALLARPGAVLSRERLMDDVWRDAPDTTDRTVDAHIKTLRAKLRAVRDDLDPIRTHRGLGYSLTLDA